MAMTREELLQTVGLAISGKATYNGSDRIAAHRVLAAILPLVSTVAELEALPQGTKLLDRRGWLWVIGEFDHHSEPHVMSMAPLTIVWQPQP